MEPREPAEPAERAPDRASRSSPLLIGGALVLLCVLGGAFFVPFGARLREHGRRIECMGQLGALGKAAIAYCDKEGHAPYADGSFEEAVALLRGGGYLERDPVCPSHPEGGAFAGFKAPTRGLFEFDSRSPTQRHGDLMLAWEVELHVTSEGSGRNVLFGNGLVRFLSEGEFQELLAQNAARWPAASQDAGR